MHTFIYNFIYIYPFIYLYLCTSTNLKTLLGAKRKHQLAVSSKYSCFPISHTNTQAKTASKHLGMEKGG